MEERLITLEYAECQQLEERLQTQMPCGKIKIRQEGQGAEVRLQFVSLEELEFFLDHWHNLSMPKDTTL